MKDEDCRDVCNIQDKSYEITLVVRVVQRAVEAANLSEWLRLFLMLATGNVHY